MTAVTLLLGLTCFLCIVCILALELTSRELNKVEREIEELKKNLNISDKELQELQETLDQSDKFER